MNLWFWTHFKSSRRWLMFRVPIIVWGISSNLKFPASNWSLLELACNNYGILLCRWTGDFHCFDVDNEGLSSAIFILCILTLVFKELSSEKKSWGYFFTQFLYHHVSINLESWGCCFCRQKVGLLMQLFGGGMIPPLKMDVGVKHIASMSLPRSW